MNAKAKGFATLFIVAMTALLVVVMTGAVVLFGYNLLTRFTWDQASLMRQYYGLVRINKSRIEYALERMQYLAELSPQTSPPPEAMTRRIKEVLEHSPSGALVTLDFSPLGKPVSLLINHPLGAAQSDEVSTFMARAILFDREYWGLNNELGGRTNLTLEDNSVRLAIPAVPAQFQPDREDVLKLFQRWARMRDSYLDKVGRVGSETIWSPTYDDGLSGDQVFSYAVPVRGEEDRFAAVLTYTLPSARLMADVTADDSPARQLAQRTILFDYNGGLLYQGEDTREYDPGSLGKQVVSRLSHISAGSVFWFERGNLMFAGATSAHGWRALYIFPLAALLQEFRGQIAVAMGLYLLGLLLVYYGVQRIRRDLLIPAQKHAEQIEQSERFNRTMLQLAPVGLRAVRIADERLEIENELARQILPQYSQYEGRSWIKYLPADRPGRLQLQTDGHNGEKSDVLIVSEPVRYQGDDVLLCAISDTTEETRARRILQEAHEAADRATRMKSLFLAAMSHEIRTPLYGMIGALELLSLGKLSPAQRQQLDTVQISSRVLLQVLNDLLDYSRVEAGQADLETISFDPVDLVETAVRAQLPVAQRKALRLACCLQPDLPRLIGDPVRIRQVLDNLLSNALKFTAQGEVSVRMWQVPDESGAKKIHLHIEVADTGIGIAPEIQKRLFEPFYQGGPATGRRYGGSGLGLSISRSYAKLMHGDISVSSTPGMGSRFLATFELGRGHARTHNDAQLPPVAVLSDDTAWQRNLIDIVTQAGGRAVPCVGDAPERDMILLVAAARAMPTPKGYANTILLQTEGPLHPEKHLDTYIVNAYSQNSILQAVCLAAGQDPDTVIPAMGYVEQNLPQLGLNILVVEDHPYSRQLIQQQLEQLGCRVQVAGNGEEALSAVEQDEFDALLTDIQMPIMDGYELAHCLRARGDTIPVIGLTAGIAEDEMERCQAAGVAGMLSKPILLVALAEALQTVLPGRISQLQRTRRQAASAQASVAEMQNLLAQTLKEDVAQLFAAFERGDMRLIGQLAHRMRGAAAQAEGGEEIAALCAELEQDLNHTLEGIRHRRDDLALYVKELFDETAR